MRVELPQGVTLDFIAAGVNITGTPLEVPVRAKSASW
jgi:hypothetical protein